MEEENNRIYKTREEELKQSRNRAKNRPREELKQS
jgi:hypothetical protein